MANWWETVRNAIDGVTDTTGQLLEDTGVIPSSEPATYPLAPLDGQATTQIVTKSILPGLELVGVESDPLDKKEAVLFGSIKVGGWVGVIMYLAIVAGIFALIYMALNPKRPARGRGGRKSRARG